MKTYFIAVLSIFLMAGSTKLMAQEEISDKNYQEVEAVSISGSSPWLNGNRPEKLPMYPDGMEGIIKRLSKKIKYPSSAYRKKIMGTVRIAFTIEKDGTVQDVEVIEGVSPDLDEEAKRVVSKMERWIPGYNDGEPVRVRYNLPIKFNLPQ